MILSLKSKLLEHEHARAPAQSEQELTALLTERDNELRLLHNEMAKRDKIIEKQKVELDLMSHDIVNKKRSEVLFVAWV